MALEDRRSPASPVDDYPAGLREQLCEIYRAPGFYRNLPPLPDGITAVREMLERGIDVRICTSPLRTYRYCVPEKFDWIMEHLGPQWIERIIVTRDKTLVHGNVLIDDKPNVTGAMRPSWEHVVYDMPFNRNVNGKRRLTWANWREMLGVTGVR